MARADKLLLDENGRMKLLPAAVLRTLPPDLLRVWCVLRARYGLPTLELMLWLQTRINGRSALEIGAGMGDLGRLLCIRMTDSHQQVTDPDTIAYCQLTKQPPTRPPADVEKIDAQTAVLKYRPAVVLGSWITQRWLPGNKEGNQHGPREEHIIANSSEYIMIGNEHIHGRKRIMCLPHETFKFDWLVSRAKDQSANVIYCWRNIKH